VRGHRIDRRFAWDGQDRIEVVKLYPNLQSVVGRYQGIDVQVVC